MKKGRIFKQERLRIFEEKRHDPYRERQKLTEPSICTGCGALFTGGRWNWDEIPDTDLNEAVCPACRRIADDYPAGYVELKGNFLSEHYDEILNLIKNTAKLEINEHPLERIIKISKKRSKTLITTTGMHLARRIGDAVFNSYQGELEYNYDAENFLRINWQRLK